MTRFLIALSLVLAGCGSSGGSGSAALGDPNNPPPIAPVLHHYSMHFWNNSIKAGADTFTLSMTTDQGTTTAAPSLIAQQKVQYDVTGYFLGSIQITCSGSQPNVWLVKDGVQVPPFNGCDPLTFTGQVF